MKIQKYLVATAALLLSCSVTMADNNQQACQKTCCEMQANAKPRTIVTCDPELDDNNSMIRFLLHATDFQIDGLIYTSSRFHWLNDGSGKTQFVELSEYDQLGLGPQKSWRFNEKERFIDNIIDAYDQCYNNLILHDPSYPTPEYLRSVCCYGNCAFEGDYSYDSDGSRLIKRCILDDKPGPLFIQAWGGSSSIAAALRSIADEYEYSSNWKRIYDKVSKKVVLCLSGDQDNAYNKYIAVKWPDIWVQNEHGNMGYYDRKSIPSLTDPEWTASHMLLGPIGNLVRCWGDGKQMVANDVYDPIGPSGYMTEEQLKAAGYVMWTKVQPKGTLYGDGDSGCYYQMIDNGLRAWQDPTWGGWTGRWDIKKGKPESGHPTYMLNDLRPLIKGEKQNFDMSAAYAKYFGNMKEDHTFPNMATERNLSEAARMKWSVTSNYEDANHYPVVNGPYDIKAKAGETITIPAKATDPDGNQLQIQWWYFPVGTYVLHSDKALSVDSPLTAETTFTVPKDAKSGDTIHLVLQAIDNGEPALTRYLRTVITVE